MQKAVLVRTALDHSSGRCWSEEVDATNASPPMPLRKLLNHGWRVVQACSMTSELDNCCLLILEQSDHGDIGVMDMPIAALKPTSSTNQSTSPAARSWDGETIPLKLFGLDV